MTSLSLSARVTDRDVVVELEVAAGETLALLGPNGAGKSTVLALAAGLLRPDDGTVALDGRVLTDVRDGRTQTWVPAYDRHVATLSQEALLLPHLSVRANVEFGPRAQGRSRREARAVAQEWLDRVGVADLAERRPGSLSGGQAQRVAVARALAAEPALLLLDEPMAALDAAATPAVRETLRQVLAEVTCVMVTHDVLDAALLADRVAVVEGGRVVEQGATPDVLARPRSVFGARIAGLNLLRGTWRHDGGSGELVATTGERVHGQAEDLTPGTAAVAVFRPTAVSVYAHPVHGSPRNTFEVVVTSVEPNGDLVRIRAGHLAADVTAQAAAELGVRPGARVWFSVKATEVSLHAS
ncbi:sulfate/molybdate ABC transporter ATP-binding protein [Nocardioides jishulii]|uniref:ATP-binding cassette domain-containing protein n=1 Tax=Nocardioides jishulii TaxID=2575440 RepID=A0A4U2YRV8_9ACTN|nr:ATP-binding cassette domain-containing protein [Nocardioides jishulii]QCX28932.1 ATP-binding cassette domain-containing protein [Nocardioides jishulii]TKI64167.1 ATP-binding cassette domain-containing protein [Nocardioides jishulii]